MGWQLPPGRVVVVVPPPAGISARIAVRQLSITVSRAASLGAPAEQSVAVASLPIAVLNFPETAVRHADWSRPLAASFESQPSSPESFLPIAATIFPSHLLAVRGSPAFPTAVLTLLSQVLMSVWTVLV